MTNGSNPTVRTIYFDTRPRDPSPRMQARLNNERDNRHQRRRLNNQQPPRDSANTRDTNVNPYRNQEGGASSSWNAGFVLTRRLEHETLEMLAIPGEVALVLTRRLKPNTGGGWSGNRRN